jgi:predicted lipoprotein with Yx(FWY)xxD motif
VTCRVFTGQGPNTSLAALNQWGGENVFTSSALGVTPRQSTGKVSTVSRFTNKVTKVTSGAAGSATPSAVGGVLAVATTSLGPVLVDGTGLTVSMQMADPPGHSTCSAQCLQLWPLVPAPAGFGVRMVSGISAALATTKATNGTSMVTAASWPLYAFVKDAAPGDVTGEGVKTFGGNWCAVSPSATPVNAPAKTVPATTNGSGSGGGDLRQTFTDSWPRSPQTPDGHVRLGE